MESPHKEEDNDGARNCCLELINYINSKDNELLHFFNEYMNQNSVKIKLVLNDISDDREEINNKKQIEEIDLPQINYDTLLIHCIFAYYQYRKSYNDPFNLLEVLMDINEIFDAEDYCYLVPTRADKDYPCHFKVITNGKIIAEADIRGDIYTRRRENNKTHREVFLDIDSDKLLYKKYKSKKDEEYATYVMKNFSITIDDLLIISMDGNSLIYLYIDRFMWDIGRRCTTEDEIYDIRIPNDAVIKVGERYTISYLLIFREKRNKEKLDS